MADYVDPTPADVKADFPVFASVDDAAIQRRIDRTSIWVDDSWQVTDYAYAKELLTAHWLQLDGLGGSDAQIDAYRNAGVSRLRSASLDVTFASSASSDTRGSGDEFDQTVWGKRFYAMLLKNKSGPLVAGVSCGGVAPASTDYPFAWAFGGFGI